MPVFVKASSRAKAYVRGTRSKVARQAQTLGLQKIQLVKSKAFTMAKSFESWDPATWSAAYPRWSHRARRLRNLETTMRSRGMDPHGRR